MSRFLENLTYYCNRIYNFLRQVIILNFLVILAIWLHTIETSAETYTCSTSSSEQNCGFGVGGPNWILNNGDTLRITSTGSIDRGTGWYSVDAPANGTIINEGRLAGNSADFYPGPNTTMNNSGTVNSRSEGLDWSDGTIINSGTINGSPAIKINSANGNSTSITNSGALNTSSSQAIRILNASGHTLVNTGTITGGAAGDVEV